MAPFVTMLILGARLACAIKSDVALFNFLAPNSEPARLIYQRTSLPDGNLREKGERFSNHEYCSSPVPLVDGRAEIAACRPPSLDANGVHFVADAVTSMFSSTVGGAGSFLDKDAVVESYYAEVEALVLSALPNTERAIVFDHNVRKVPRRAPDRRPMVSQQLDDEPFEPKRASTQFIEMAHNDYTEASATKRIADFIEKPSYTTGRPPLEGEELENLLEKHFMFLSVWRNTADTPIVDVPLAVFDAQHMERDDLTLAEIFFQDRGGEIQFAKHNEGQRAFWFPEMQKDEALLLKTFDSRCLRANPEGQRGFWACHSAFTSPFCPSAEEEFVSRESIEARVIVFFQES